MPVITVVAAALGSADEERAGLATLNRVVAMALALAPADVVSVHVPAGLAVRGDGQVAPWPIVTLHGRDRGAGPARTAATAAALSVARSWGCDPDEVSVRWSTG